MQLDDGDITPITTEKHLAGSTVWVVGRGGRGVGMAHWW